VMGPPPLPVAASILWCHYAVAEFVVLSDDDAEKPIRRKKKVDTTGIRVSVWFIKPDAILQRIVFLEDDPTCIRSHFNPAIRAWFLVGYGDRPKQGNGNTPSFFRSLPVVAMMIVSSENLLPGSGLLYVARKAGSSRQSVQGGLPLEVDHRVAVLEALHGVLNGHFTIAEVFVGLGDVGENPRVLRSQSEGGLGVGDGFFAKMVLRKEHTEHRLRTRILGIH